MPLESWALTTVERVEDAYGLTPGEYTIAIEFAINSASAQLEALTDRKLKSRTYTDEYFDGINGQYLLLPQYPVSAVSALKTYDNYNSLVNTIPVADLAQLKIDPDGILYLPQDVFGTGVRNILISYTAGITDPADLLVLENAVLDLIGMNVPGQTRTNSAIRRESLGQYSVSYFDMTTTKWSAMVQYAVDRFLRYV